MRGRSPRLDMVYEVGSYRPADAGFGADDTIDCGSG